MAKHPHTKHLVSATPYLNPDNTVFKWSVDWLAQCDSDGWQFEQTTNFKCTHENRPVSDFTKSELLQRVSSEMTDWAFDREYDRAHPTEQTEPEVYESFSLNSLADE